MARDDNPDMQMRTVTDAETFAAWILRCGNFLRTGNSLHHDWKGRHAEHPIPTRETGDYGAVYTSRDDSMGAYDPIVKINDPETDRNYWHMFQHPALDPTRTLMRYMSEYVTDGWYSSSTTAAKIAGLLPRVVDWEQQKTRFV